MTSPDRDSRPPACRIPLPAGFRVHDLLAFHARDRQAVAERVEDGTMRKGLAWNGRAACLTLRLREGWAEAELAVDGGDPGPGLEAYVRRLLGLTQPVEAFERDYAAHPLLGPLIAADPGLRVALCGTPFEALSWAITGQQISLGAAMSLRRRLIQAAGLQHSGGLACYPDAPAIARLTVPDLRAAGFSQTKAQTLLAVSRLVAEERLPLGAWEAAEPLPVEEIRQQLRQVRGIGPWTVDYALLRGFGWLDGSLHGDVAVRRGLQALLGSGDKVGEEQAKTWLAAFSPWRALVAAHLWALNVRNHQGAGARGSGR